MNKVQGRRWRPCYRPHWCQLSTKCVYKRHLSGVCYFFLQRTWENKKNYYLVKVVRLGNNNLYTHLFGSNSWLMQWLNKPTFCCCWSYAVQTLFPVFCSSIIGTCSCFRRKTGQQQKQTISHVTFSSSSFSHFRLKMTSTSRKTMDKIHLTICSPLASSSENRMFISLWGKLTLMRGNCSIWSSRWYKIFLLHATQLYLWSWTHAALASCHGWAGSLIDHRLVLEKKVLTNAGSPM